MEIVGLCARIVVATGSDGWLGSVRRLSGSMILAMENVRFRQGVEEVTLSGGRLVGGSVAIVLPDANGCILRLKRK